ncbi:MAG: hypothetical protein ACLP9L_21925 [Thermoguttaceae bacterium]
MKKSGPLHYLGSLLVLAVFAAAAWLLLSELRRHDMSFEKIRDNLLQIPASHIAIAMVLTIINYGVLVFYDYLAFRYAKVPISLARVTFAALTSYSFSCNFSATWAGIPLRYRLYSSWQISLNKILQLLVILALTFWFGVFFLAGTLFVFAPLKIPPEELQSISTKLVTEWHIHENVVQWFVYLFADSRPFGSLLLAMSGLYVGTSLLHRGSLKLFRWTLPVPPFRLTIYQIAIASADMLVAGSVLYSLFPPVHGGYLTVLEVYLVAYVLIVLSHVPGGWGVLEAVMMTLLGALKLVPDHATNMPKVFAAIIVFRVIYFLLPLAFGAGLFGWHEYALRKKWIPPLAADPDGHADGAARPEEANGHAGKNGTTRSNRHLPSERK